MRTPRGAISVAASALAALVPWSLAACDDGGGSGGSTAGAGAGASAPSPETKAATFARAAVVVGSCVPDDGVNRHLANFWHAADIPQLWGRFAAQAGCLASAGGGCDAVTECLGYGIDLGTCVPGCRGSVFTFCEDSVATSVDCAKLGLACDAAAACTEGSVTACDDQSHVATCDASGLPLTCNDGAIRRGPDCAALGLRCEDGACRGPGPACTLDPPLSEYHVEYVGIACEGDVMRACVAGAEHALDCAAFAPGFSCREADGVRFCGLAAECVPGNLPNHDQSGTMLGCEGDSTLAFCNAGRIDRVDCRDLGFERCDPANEGGGCAPNFISELLEQL